MKTLTCGAQEAVAGWVVAELIFTEQAPSDRGTTLRTRHVRFDPGLLAGLDVLDLEIAPISDDRDPLHAENLFCRFGGSVPGAGMPAGKRLEPVLPSGSLLAPAV
jgi:hypothetical protein